jgi:hypothetical protein
MFPSYQENLAFVMDDSGGALRMAGWYRERDASVKIT